MELSKGVHHHESHWINKENKAESEGKWGTLTKVRAAEGHLGVRWGTGTGPAGGCQPYQQQDARGHRCQGGHGGFCRVREEGLGSSQLS